MMIPNFSKIGGFFEEHVEKIVLVIVGALCAWLLVTRVILSPNMVTYKDKNWSPAAIDEQIYKEAQLLRQKRREAAQQLEPYKRKADEYASLLKSSIRDVNTKLWPVLPYVPAAGPGGTVQAGVYNLPRIPDVNGVDVEHIRAVGYMPIAEVTAERPYDKAGNEPNDLDLVTVAADIDIASLYRNFKEVFVEDVDPQWADPCLAKPVFAAVQLQRQQLTESGVWSDWQDIPRTRIDPHKRLFQIVEDVKDLPAGGLKVQMLQYDYKQIQIDLLQPEAYQIATADEEWYPPSLHRQFVDYQRRVALEEKRQAQEAEKKEESTRAATTDTGLTNRRTTSRTRGGDSYGGAGDSMYGGTDARSRRGRTGDRTGTTGGAGYPGETGRGRSARGGARGQTDSATDMMYDYGMDGPGSAANRKLLKRPAIYDIYDKYDLMRLTRLTEFEKIKSALVFWSHDDTVEPGQTYRYRVRVGLFNPVAGTDKLSDRDKAKKNDVILWSNYSSVTKPVEIMERMYFFANRVRETDKAVTVQVSRLALGRWYSHDFIVQHGELIGEPLEPEPEKPDRNAPGGALGAYPGGYPRDPAAAAAMGRLTTTPYGGPQEKSNVPKIINYATGAVMVDAVVVNDWVGEPTLRSRNFYDMLYSFDGINIDHMPVGATYWESKLQTAFGLIARMQRETQKPFKAFGTAGRQQRPGGEMMEGYDEYMMEDMYNMGGMGDGRPLY